MTTELQTVPETNAGGALGLIQQAMATGASPEHLRELLAVKKEWEADEARKAFFRSMAAFQAECPIIPKADKAHNKTYARMDRIWSVIRPIMEKHRLLVMWQTCEFREGYCRLAGTLAHADGHSVALIQEIPLPEIVSGQNKAQQMGSARTYAERYASCGALGVKTGDEFDDDGNMGKSEFVSAEQADELTKLIDACRGVNAFNEAAFWKFSEAKTVTEISAKRFNELRDALKGKLKG